MKVPALLTSTSLLLASALPLSAGPLGAGSNYDVIVENNFTLQGAHIHGSSAVGGNVVLSGSMSEFGNHMVAGSGPGLVVGGKVVLGTDARVNGPGIANIGSLGAGQSTTPQGLTGGGKTLYASTVNVGAVALDLAAAFSTFSLLSQSMAALNSTVTLASVTSGDAVNKQLNLNFAAGTGYQVLDLSLADFLSFKNIQVGAAAASTQSWIINVDLTGYSGAAITQNRNGSDSGAEQILWNFYGASTLTLANQFYGTVFAPDLAFTHQNNDLKGQVIASSFTKIGGQVHDHRYEGKVPNVPDSVPTLGLVAGVFAGLMLLRARRA